MPRVENIRVIELDLRALLKSKSGKSVEAKAMSACVKLLDEKTLDSLLPKRPRLTVAFTLKDTDVNIANAIRRCLINEMEVFSLAFDPHDVKTDDRFILKEDDLLKQIALLPLFQEYFWNTGSHVVEASNLA